MTLPPHRSETGVGKILDEDGVLRVHRPRALWHFFAPFIPIQIMVPQAHAEEAAKLLKEHHLARQ